MLRKFIIILIVIALSVYTACGKPPAEPSPTPPSNEPDVRQTPPPMTAAPQGNTPGSDKLDAEIYEWLRLHCGDMTAPEGYPASSEEALKRFSVYMRSYWEYFSDLDFPGDYHAAFLYADKYDFEGWDESWMLILMGAHPDGYEWSDSLVLNAADGQILFGPSDGWNTGYDPDTESIAAAREKYYDYFASNNYLINPFITYASAGDIDDGALMRFAFLNSAYEYDKGLKTSDVDRVLLKYFGRTVRAYQTDASDYDQAAGIVRPSGWDALGAYRLMLTKLTENSDGSITGVFNVYLFEEMFLLEHPGALEAARDFLIYGDATQFELYARARITFEELAEPGGFYLKFKSIEALFCDRPTDPPPASYDYDSRQFDPNSRFSASESAFSGITIGMPTSNMLHILGEPFEILDIEDRADEKIYVYGGFEIYAGDYVNVISVVGFHWKYGPRNIRVGDSFAEVLSKFPSEKDWRNDPAGCFYGDDTMNGDAGAVYETGANPGDSHLIIVTPPDIVPFIRINFEHGRVATINICSLS